jgi:hypothetical protein
MVERSRPSLSAIARFDQPKRYRSAMRTRSSSDKNPCRHRGRWRDDRPVVVLAASGTVTPTTPPSLTGLAVNAKLPTHLRIVQPLFHQAKVKLTLDD